MGVFPLFPSPVVKDKAVVSLYAAALNIVDYFYLESRVRVTPKKQVQLEGPYASSTDQSGKVCLQAKVKRFFHNPRSRQAKPPSDLPGVAVRMTTGLVGSLALLVSILLLSMLYPADFPWTLSLFLWASCRGTVWDKSFLSQLHLLLLVTCWLHGTNFPSASENLPVSFSIFLMLCVKSLVLLLNSVTGVSPLLFSKHFGY